MSSYVELQVLKQEEKTLLKLQHKLSDQLNRLKVEELALLSQIRAGQIEESSYAKDEVEQHKTEQEIHDDNINEQPLFNLGPSTHFQVTENDVLEEEDDDDSQAELTSAQDQLTLFMRHLEHQTKS